MGNLHFPTFFILTSLITLRQNSKPSGGGRPMTRKKSTPQPLNTTIFITISSDGQLENFQLCNKHNHAFSLDGQIRATDRSQ